MDKISEKYVYIYVLQLPFSRWYVGCTRNFDNRIRVHFKGKGSVATRECKPIGIHKVYGMDDHRIRARPARQIAEVLVANEYAEKYGYDNVRGGKHGKGWNDEPSPNNLRDIASFKKYLKTDDGIALMNSLTEISPKYLLRDDTIQKYLVSKSGS